MRTVASTPLAILAAAIILCSTAVAAQSYKHSFVRIARGDGPAILYEPATPGPKSSVAVFVSHPGSDWLADVKCTQLVSRGYRVLCYKMTFDGMNSLDWDKELLQVRDGVMYLKKLSGVNKIVLLGHSGGGPLFSTYQNIAENGARTCQGQEKIVPCPAGFANMPAADGLILMDPILGYGAYTAINLDPAVRSEGNGVQRDWRLDPYDKRNGYDSKGASYSEAFLKRFALAQKKRNDRIIAKALARLEALNAKKGDYTDDEPFIVPGGIFSPTPNLWYMDTRLWSHTHDAYPLLKRDGTAPVQVVHTVRLPKGGPASPTTSYERAALVTSVRRFLHTFATRTGKEGARYGEDFIEGVDYSSSYSNTPWGVEGVGVPLLIVGMGAGTLLVSNEVAYQHAKSSDKTLAYVEGALHLSDPCKECEKTPGEFGDTTKTTFDYFDAWLSKRFISTGMEQRNAM